MGTNGSRLPQIQIQFLHDIREQQHFHQNLELLYVAEGELLVAKAAREYRMKQEDVLLVNSNNSHSLTGQDGLSFLKIHIPYQFLEALGQDGSFAFSCNSTEDSSHSYEEIRRIMKSILFSYVGTPKKTEALRYSYILELLNILIESFQTDTEGDTDSKDQQDEQILQSIIRYVSLNYQEKINLGKLAEQMYTSTSTLSRLFKKNMGCYFGDFVNQVRLDRAVQELTGTDKTVTKIAVDCGFASLAVFNKQFQNAYQMSPTAYRAAKQEEQAAAPSIEGLDEDIKRLHLEPPSGRLRPSGERVAAEIAAGPGTAYKRCWNQVLNAGAAYDLTIGNVQGHIAFLHEHLNFQYVRIWNLFSQRMMIRQDSSSRQYNFNALDNVLDFMMAHKMVPYLDFGPRPNCAVKAEGQMVYYEEEYLDFRDADDWEGLFRAFVNHIAQRYGRETTAGWIYDFTLDVRYSSLPFCDTQAEVWQLYQRFFRYLKQNLPAAQVGGIGSSYITSPESMALWLTYCKEQDCVPDFLSVVVFPYTQVKSATDYGSKRMAGDQEEARQIRQCRELLDQKGLQQCKLFVVEWNSSLSTRNWLNDSCFRGAHFLRVLNQAWGCPDMIGIWMGTDWCSSYYDTSHVANGGNGMLSKDGIRKPIYHALAFLNRMHAGCLQRGPNYIVTANAMNSYYILCYNWKRYSYRYFRQEENDLDVRQLSELFENDEELCLQMTLARLPEDMRFVVKKRTVNDENGSLLGEWSRFEYDRNLDGRDVQYLRKVCVPRLSMHRQTAEKGRLTLTATLKAHEITLFHVYEDRS